MDEGTGVTTVTGGQTSGKQAPINWQSEGMSVEERGDAVAMGTGVVRERGAGKWNSLAENGNLILDAALLPLQRFFRDALHSEHLSRRPLLCQDYL